MDLIKAYYRFGSEEISPKEIILIMVSSIVGALTSILLTFGIEIFGFSIFKIGLIILGIVLLTPVLIFVLMIGIWNLFFKN